MERPAGYSTCCSRGCRNCSISADRQAHYCGLSERKLHPPRQYHDTRTRLLTIGSAHGDGSGARAIGIAAPGFRSEEAADETVYRYRVRSRPTGTSARARGCKPVMLSKSRAKY